MEGSPVSVPSEGFWVADLRGSPVMPPCICFIRLLQFWFSRGMLLSVVYIGRALLPFHNWQSDFDAWRFELARDLRRRAGFRGCPCSCSVFSVFDVVL